MKEREKKSLCLAVITTILLFFAMYGPGIQNDLFFSIKNGEIFSKYGFARQEVLGMHKNFKAMQPHCMTALLDYILYDHFGFAGITVFFMSCSIVLFFVTCRYITYLTKNKNISLLISLVLSYSVVYITGSRPQMITFTALVTELYLIELYAENNSNKVFFIIPLAVIVANFHSAMFVMIYIFALPYIGEAVWERIFHKKKSNIFKLLAALLLAGILSAVLNPYGPLGITFLLRSTGSIRPLHIHELSRSDIVSNPLLYGCVCLSMLGFILKHNKDVGMRFYLLYFGTLLMALMYVRNTGFFFIAMAIMMAMYLKNEYKEAISPHITIKTVTAVLLVITMGVGAYMGFQGNEKILEKYKAANQKTCDYAATDWLAEHYDPEGTVMFNCFNEGAYLIWNGFHPYIDPRADIFGKSSNEYDDVSKEYMDFMEGDLSFDEIDDKYHFNTVFVSGLDNMRGRETFLKRLPDWPIVYETEQSIILRKGE